MKDLRNYSLLHHNTFGIEAHCRRFIEIETDDDARRLPSVLGAADHPLLIVGGGSNLLLTADYGATVLHSAIGGMETAGGDGDTVLVRVGSGEKWDDVVKASVERGWHGAENLSLIPGDVGATAVQNIGAYGAEASHIIYNIEAVEIATGKSVTIAAADCDYGYRHSRFKDEWRGRYLITHVTYRLHTTFTPMLDYGNIREALRRQATATTRMAGTDAQRLRQAIISIRREKLPDPSVEGNAGSFFMNPVVSHEKFEELLRKHPSMPHYDVSDAKEDTPASHPTAAVKIPAGWLIEQCGWKGRTMGRAGVHSRQALVLVNRGGATGADILALCQAVQNDVKARFGIELLPEVNIV